jgi:uncharacterized protein YndB with AHSA1/START domain
MPVTNVTKDPQNLTMTVVADFAAPLQRVWDAYTDPRQIEKFWGPPSHPATFTRHDVFPGGFSDYFMTGPDGSTNSAGWEWIDVKEPEGGSAAELASFEVKDFFTDENGSPDSDDMRMMFQFESTPNGSRVITTTVFASAEQLQQMLEMGMEQGMTEAMGQIDAVLADLTSFAHGVGTRTDILSDTQIRISRVIRGSVEQVWRAHTEPDLMRRWLTGPEGWVMTRCDFPLRAGASYRFDWAREDDPSEAFGFGGEVQAVEPSHRLVTVERMYGDDGPAALQVITLTPTETGTLLSQVMTYPDTAARDQALESGMTDGMEASYARLEGILA